MAVPTITLNNGHKVPVLGLGTWQSAVSILLKNNTNIKMYIIMQEQSFARALMIDNFCVFFQNLHSYYPFCHI